jgi:chitinase
MTKAGSDISAVQAWTTANFPANKIALGVPAYGHSFHVDKTAAVDSSGNLASYPPFDKSQQPHGDNQDGNAGLDQCGVQVPTSGIFDFWGLIDGGFLNADGTAATGINYRYDNCSQTVSSSLFVGMQVTRFDSLHSAVCVQHNLASYGVI